MNRAVTVVSHLNLLFCDVKLNPTHRNEAIGILITFVVCTFAIVVVSTGSTTGSTALSTIGKTLSCLQIGAICGLCTGPFFGPNGSNSESLCLNHTVVMILTNVNSRKASASIRCHDGF